MAQYFCGCRQGFGNGDNFILGLRLPLRVRFRTWFTGSEGLAWGCTICIVVWGLQYVLRVGLLLGCALSKFDTGLDSSKYGLGTDCWSLDLGVCSGFVEETCGVYM